jgi:hypothetical protein
MATTTSVTLPDGTSMQMPSTGSLQEQLVQERSAREDAEARLEAALAELVRLKESTPTEAAPVPPPAEPQTVAINGDTVPVTAEPGVDIEKCLGAQRGLAVIVWPGRSGWWTIRLNRCPRVQLHPRSRHG